MKIVTYVLIALLVVASACGAYFYLVPYKQMATEYAKLKAGQPEFEKARRELNKFREKEKLETAWTGPAAEKLRAGLKKRIDEGKAEVVVSGNRIIINISETVLFTPNSMTFAKDSQQDLAVLAALLKDFKDRDIIIGDATMPAPAQGKGRKKVPGKDARTLASGRMLELVKHLAKNGVTDEALIAAAYPSKMPDRGFKLKSEKVVVVISAPSVAEAASASSVQDAKPAVSTKPMPNPAPASQIKTIPISTVPPVKVP